MNFLQVVLLSRNVLMYRYQFVLLADIISNLLGSFVLFFVLEDQKSWENSALKFLVAGKVAVR